MADRTQATKQSENGALMIRAADFAPASWDPKTRTMDVILSTGATVHARDHETGEEYTESLSVEPGAIDTRIVDSGTAAVLADHGERMSTAFGPTQPIPSLKQHLGRILENSIRYEDGQALAKIKLTTAPDVAHIITRLLDDTLRGVSVGFYSLEWTETAGENGALNHRHVTRWLLAEQSFVPIPADAGARTRSQEDVAMAEPVKKAEKAPDTAPVVQAPDIESVRSDAAKGEAQRQTAIRNLCQRHSIDLAAAPSENDPPAMAGIRAALEDPAVDIGSVRSLALDALAAKSDATRVAAAVTVTRDSTETQIRGMTTALCLRANLPVDEKERDIAREYRGDTWLDIARRCLQADGFRVAGLSRVEIVQAALHHRAAHVTADFPNLTAALMGKALQAERALSQDYLWFQRVSDRVDLPDYKAHTVVDLGGLGQLAQVDEGAEYTRATFGDEKVDWHLVKYGREVALTEELLINDDLNGFLRLVRMFARAATVTQSALSATAITSNPTMGDGVALFDAAHSNVSGSAGAPTVARLAEGDNALRDMVDLDGARVGRPARLIISPTTHRTTLEQIYSPQYKPTTSANAVTVMIDAADRLYPPPFSGNPWYMHTGDTLGMEHGYLSGEGGPVVSNYAEERSDAKIYHCRLVFGARVIDWRAWFYNAGA